jgi:hypothetical protein
LAAALAFCSFVDAAPRDCGISSRRIACHRTWCSYTPARRIRNAAGVAQFTEHYLGRDASSVDHFPGSSARPQTTFSVRRLELAIAVLLTASLFLGTGISAIGHLYASFLSSNEVVLDDLNATFSFIILTGLFAIVYKVLPGVAIEWRDVVLGAAATSLLFTLGNIFLGLYLGTASFSSAYGAAASTVVLTLWIYLFRPDIFPGSGIHPNVRQPVRLASRSKIDGIQKCRHRGATSVAAGRLGPKVSTVIHVLFTAGNP